MKYLNINQHHMICQNEENAMYVVNSNGETLNVSEAVHFMKPEVKLERMNVFAGIMRNNFGEDVGFTFAHQPFYTNDAFIFFCRTRF